MSLRKYVEKRDFAKTPEPKGGGAQAGGERRFVIQKHAASHLHYDFRLQIGGALKSWAVPKGPPYAKGGKRLAMHVEDHPVSYRDFEGVIPKGQYGGGTVMIWDFGTFEPLSRAPAKDLESGKLHFILHGKKLEGEWYLVRLKRGEKEWLLIRGSGDMEPVSKTMDDTSALSGKHMRQIAQGERTRQSNRAGKNESKKPAVKPRRILPFFQPMMAKLVKSPASGDWQYEIKYDGFRALAFLNKGEVRLISRNGKDLGGKFPEVVHAFEKVKTENTILDGEIVALDAKGRSSFQLLQAFELGQERPPLVYYLFDIPQLEGRDLRSLSLEHRRAQLQHLLPRSRGLLQVSQILKGDGAALLEQARKLGLEGLIGKRMDSVYEPGRRSGAWIKLKSHREQEFVIGGYSDPAGTRHHFGALLVGVYQGRKLVFAGKVGTGFNDAVLKALIAEFRKIAVADCPFENIPESSRGRYGGGITGAEMRRCHWLKPKLVGQVRFAEWTRDGKLRQPVFLGLRDDKRAIEVVREEAA